MKVRSYAKINLGLEVIRKREDGYHEIRTLFQGIDLYDELEFSLTEHEEIVLGGDDSSITWDKDNLVFKTALLLKNYCCSSQGIEIYVRKKIPAGKGLGGGSSNAAVTLLALNLLWGLHLEKKDLLDLGGAIGADVPFFFEGGLCLGKERGDKIVPLPDLEPFYCVLAIPSLTISTPSIYGQFSLTPGDKDSKIIRFLAEKNISSLENRLEETVFRLYPQLKGIKDLFQSLGSELSLVSGTGSAVFGLFRERERAERGQEELRRICPAFLVETLAREDYRKKLGVGV